MSPSWYDLPLYDIEWVTMMTKGDDNIKNNKISSSTHPQLCCTHPLPRWYSEVLTSSPATMFWSTCHLSGSYEKSKSAIIIAQIKVINQNIVENFTLSKCISLVQQNWMASLHHKRPSWGLFPFINLEIYFFGLKRKRCLQLIHQLKQGRGSVHSSHPCRWGMDQRLLNLLNLFHHNVLTILLHHPQIFNLQTIKSFPPPW